MRVFGVFPELPLYFPLSPAKFHANLSLENRLFQGVNSNFLGKRAPMHSRKMYVLLVWRSLINHFDTFQLELVLETETEEKNNQKKKSQKG